MHNFDVEAASNHLAPLLDKLAAGNPGAAKPQGFIADQIAVPDDFDGIGAEKIKELFDGSDEFA